MIQVSGRLEEYRQAGGVKKALHINFYRSVLVKLNTILWICAPCAIAFASGTAHGQKYPEKPIRIVTAEAGGSFDFGARLIARELAMPLGQQIVVDNRGGGVIPGEIVASAQPNGYTLLFYGTPLWVFPLLRDRVSWDPIGDFAPITAALSYPLILVAHPSLPAKSVKELIALAKAQPGTLNYASAATGAAAHLTMELFKYMAGVDIVRVAYKGAGPALNALVGGQVQVSFPATASGMPHVKTGRLRAFAVSSARPSALAPGLPTVAASGLPGFESAAIIALFAPAKTPMPIVNRLNQEVVRILAGEDVKEKFLNGGVETMGGSPGELAALMKSEMVRLGKLIKDVGIRAD